VFNWHLQLISVFGLVTMWVCNGRSLWCPRVLAGALVLDEYGKGAPSMNLRPSKNNLGSDRGGESVGCASGA